MNWDAYWGLAIVEAERMRARERQRAFLETLLDEVAGLAAALAVPDGCLPDWPGLDVSFFYRNRATLGSLPAEHASKVTRAYELVIELKQRYGQSGAMPQPNEPRACEAMEGTTAALEQIRAAIQSLANPAGMATA